MTADTLQSPPVLSGRQLLKRFLLSVAVLPFTATYSFCFLWQTNSFLQTIVLGTTLFLVCLAWYRWKWAVFTYIFCIPLFNTMPQILSLAWPGFSFNAIMLSALLTSWAFHLIWKKPISSRQSQIYCFSTPFDGIILACIIVVLAAFPIGWFRFHNILSPGFYPDALNNILATPFFTLQDNYLCFTRVWQFSLIILSFYLVASSLRHRRDIILSLWLLMISGSLVCMYGIFQRQTGFKWVGINWFFERINATLNGPDSAALYFSCILILCTAMLFVAKSYVRRTIIVLYGGISIVGLILTQTRTAVFALIIVSGLIAGSYVLHKMIHSRRVRYVLLGSILAILFLAPGNTLFFPGEKLKKNITQSRFFTGFNDFEFTEDQMNTVLSYREYHWSAAGRVIKQYPVTGAGLGTFDKLYKTVKQEKDTYKTAFAHSLYLDTYVEMGFAGVLVLLLLYVFAALLSWKLVSAPEASFRTRTISLAFFAIILVTFISNFFTSSFYYVIELQLWFALLLALLARLYQFTMGHHSVSLTSHIQDVLQKSRTIINASPLRKGLVVSLGLLIIAFWSYTVFGSIMYGRAFFLNARTYSSIDRILEYGIYHYERDKNQNQFARTARKLYKPVKLQNRYLRLYLRADHPDAKDHPVDAAIFMDGTLIGEVSLSNRNWSLQYFDLNPTYPDLPADHILSNPPPAVLHMRSSRTWNPYKTRRGDKDLEYGIDLGAIEWGYF
jgi:O-antigen ligase